MKIHPSLTILSTAIVFSVSSISARAAESIEERLNRIDRQQQLIREQNQALIRHNKETDRENAVLKKKIATLEAAQANPAAKKDEKEEKKNKVCSSTDDQVKANLPTSIQDASTRFSTPDAPAAAVLGIAPEKVIHASTP